jgi:uncharacterized protein (DUF58 family)
MPRPSRALAPASRRPSLGAPHERVGLHALRVRGMGGDLRELREHAPGDPFKQIAWKATARTGKLMVRELDRETMVTHFLLVDIAGTMRQGRPGLQRLDLAVEVAAGYARSVLEAGDRVGLVTFDGRVVGEVKPNDGPAHRLRIVERLMDAMSVVEEDLTELTDSELVAVVARYLLLQEGIDARLRRAPPMDDPAWGHLAVSPTGELYDLQIVDKAVAAIFGRTRARAGSVDDSELGRLRRFCRLRGIELPYRRMSEAGRRARGLGAALELAAAGRGTQRILVLSDLDQLDGDLAAVQRAVRLVRRRGHHLLFAVPPARLALDDGKGGTPRRQVAATQIADIFGWHERRRERAAERRLAGLGVRVVTLKAEGAASLLAGWSAEARARVAAP